MKLAILGATGSIGENSLRVAEAFPDKIEICALTCGFKVEKLAQAIVRHRPPVVAVHGPRERERLLAVLADMPPGPCPEILYGPAGQAAAATQSGAEMVLSAIVGQAGLPPTAAAVRAGLKLALANKESLVIGGELLMKQAAESGSLINPVDSEHSAIFQIMGGWRTPALRRVILTASGGPFRGLKAVDLREVSREQALRHPSWRMGPKISCDSATMMNKGFELIEAHHLFGLPYEQLEVLVHPQSLIHSIVEFVDGAQMMQAGPSDMRQAIAYALSYPERWPLLDKGFPSLNLAAQPPEGRLSFEAPDAETFRCLTLAQEAGKRGGTAPAVLCGANDEAVDLFLAGAIKFLDIPRLVEEALNLIPFSPLSSVEQGLAVVEDASRLVRELAQAPARA